MKPEPEQTSVERDLNSVEGVEEFMRGRVWNRTNYNDESPGYMKYVAGEMTAAIQYYTEVLKNIENRERDRKEARRQGNIAIISLINIIFELHKEPRIGEHIPLIIIILMLRYLDMLEYHVKESHNHLHDKFLKGKKTVRKLYDDI